MTNDENSRPMGLRDEAADWFAIMRGPEAEARQAEFNAWLARGALHRTAFNSIANTYSVGKGLKPPPESEDGPQSPDLGSSQESEDAPKPSDTKPPSPGSRRRRIVAGGLVVALIGGTVALLPQLVGPERGDRPVAQIEPARSAPAQLSTQIGEIRSFSLADGSSVTLDSDSLVLVTITPVRRDLQLVRGRARFTVAHDLRPFVVAVVGGTVTARGGPRPTGRARARRRGALPAGRQAPGIYRISALKFSS
jgi:transmembrane sensor